MENKQIRNSETVASYIFSYSWKWLQEMYFREWRAVSHLHSNTACAESQLVWKGCGSRGAELLQDLPHIVHALPPDTFLRWFKFFHFTHNMSFHLPLSLFLLHFSKILLSCIPTRNLTDESEEWTAKIIHWQNISSRDNVKGDTRIILIPFPLTTKISCLCHYFFSSMLGKNYHVKKEQCLLAHFKIPSYWQARTEKCLRKLLRGDSRPAQNFWESHL